MLKHDEDAANEASYEGNLGVSEIVYFHWNAPDDLIAKYKQLEGQEKYREAMNIVQDFCIKAGVLDKRLQGTDGKEFGEE